MAILRYGTDLNQLAFQQRWSSPYWVAGSGNVWGLWMEPLRESNPANWDKVGWGHLTARTNPNQAEFRISQQVIIFNVKTLFLFPTDLSGTEFKLELDLVDWVSLISIDFGTVLKL